ncbi:DUF3617 domain-containing protein [Sphingomicrobium flavum]|uniref:DUF3617 domain-containing protein n=1 Tax=Sphingomicrobium flavum TaxID=1229164 RepID=UPI0021ADDD55|nr:DUF3617 family protein [Sphingomicrobium flavum]
MRNFALLLVAMTLASCSAADDPDNVPIKGLWESEYRISSIRAGHEYMSGNELPAAFRNFRRTERVCAEPRFAEKDAFFDDFAAHMKGQCEMTDYNVTTTSMTATGYCKNVADIDYDPTLRVRGDIGPENFKMVLTFDGAATIPGAGRRAVEMIAVAEATRVGDC